MGGTREKTQTTFSADSFRKRTKQYALRVIRLVEKLPKDRVAATIGLQLLRCGTSVGANYRAACRARSPAEFRAKMGIVEEEADEAAYWLELICDAGIVRKELLSAVCKETDELVRMTVASIATSRRQSIRPK